MLSARLPAPVAHPQEAEPITLAIEAEGLAKSFGKTRALEGVDLAVEEGTVLGLLGPNGAGKTTAVRILATLLAADEGWARVAGYDVSEEPAKVRTAIGLTGQYAAIDDTLTGRENLTMVAELSQLARRDARRRAGELLQSFELEEAADRIARTYSGGMRRRLDLAASLVAHPRILFLDEPTTGLDPRSRRGMWQVIRELVTGGTTLLLTTQYLDEADELADRVAVIDRGTMVAEGTSDELKDRVGGDVAALRPVDPERVHDAAAILRDLARQGEVGVEEEDGGGTVTLPLGRETTLLAEAIRRLDDEGIALAGIALREPSLDDVFFSITGQSPGADDGAEGGG